MRASLKQSTTAAAHILRASLPWVTTRSVRRFIHTSSSLQMPVDINGESYYSKKELNKERMRVFQLRYENNGGKNFAEQLKDALGGELPQSSAHSKYQYTETEMQEALEQGVRNAQLFVGEVVISAHDKGYQAGLKEGGSAHPDIQKIEKEYQARLKQEEVKLRTRLQQEEAQKVQAGVDQHMATMQAHRQRDIDEAVIAKLPGEIKKAVEKEKQSWDAKKESEYDTLKTAVTAALNEYTPQPGWVSKIKDAFTLSKRSYSTQIYRPRLQGVRAFSTVKDLIIAVQNDDTQTIGQASKHHPTLITQQTHDDNTPFHEAARLGKADMIEYLSKNFPALNVNHKCHCYKQRTALHYAAAEGHVEAVDKLFSLGANPNISNEHNETPLDNAIQGIKSSTNQAKTKEFEAIAVQITKKGGKSNLFSKDAEKIILQIEARTRTEECVKEVVYAAKERAEDASKKYLNQLKERKNIGGNQHSGGGRWAA